MVLAPPTGSIAEGKRLRLKRGTTARWWLRPASGRVKGRAVDDCAWVFIAAGTLVSIVRWVRPDRVIALR
jgi:uncharacterized PurR-regulated membrane protein YhhQ (DUF165 family)